jgi:mycothiol synthase
MRDRRPGLQRYNWRAAEERDLPNLGSLDAACLTADGPASVRWTTYPEMLAVSGSTILCAITGDGSATGEQIAAAGWVRRSGKRVWLEGKVHPEHRRRGLGTHLLRWTEERARGITAPANWAILNEVLTEGSAALYAQERYECDFAEDWMQRDLREPLPRVEARFATETWSDENAMEFFEAYVEAFRERRGHGAPEPVAEDWIAEYSEDSEFRPDLSLLARTRSEAQSGEAVGFLTAGVMRIADLSSSGSGEVGWISQVGVHPAWRGRGVAAGLIAQTMEAFRREGLLAVGLHVNVDNPGAGALYERLGFKRMGRRAKYSKSV